MAIADQAGKKTLDEFNEKTIPEIDKTVDDWTANFDRVLQKNINLFFDRLEGVLDRFGLTKKVG